MKSDEGFMSQNGIVGRQASVRDRGSVFIHQAVLIGFLSLMIGFGILVAPTRSRAQNAPAANPDTSQAANHAEASPPAMKKAEMPEGEGKAIAEKYCQACHELTNLTHASKSLDDWRDTVSVMIDNGAEVPPDKVNALVKYLAKNFGPKPETPAADTHEAANPPASSVGSAAAVPAPLKEGELPDGDGKEIATNSCQACHTLSNLTNAHMNEDQWRAEVQIMIDRGADVPADKVDTLVKYLAKNFCPKTPAPPQ